MASKQKKNFLPLKKKVEVIKAHENDRGLSHRALGKMFQCGRTQVAQIIKNKDSILALFKAKMLLEAGSIPLKSLVHVSMKT